MKQVEVQLLAREPERGEAVYEKCLRLINQEK